MTRKVCVVVTARPTYSRVKTVLQAVEAHVDLELQLVVAASALLDRYGRVIDQIEADGFTPVEEVHMIIEGENPTSMAKSTGMGLLEMATVLDNLEPDVVVTVADRYETMATAVAASYMNIPLAHIQGGEVSGSIDEKVRHAVTKLSDLHLVSTAGAAERVIKMGEQPATVHDTGCPSVDLAAATDTSGPLGFDPTERYGGVGADIDYSAPYVVVMQHPVTTQHEVARAQVEATLDAVHRLGTPAVWFWPNVDAGSDGTSRGIRAFRERHDGAPIRFFKNLSPADFLDLMVRSAAMVGNSSVAIREGAYLGVPAVNIGTRQAGRERAANVVDVDHDVTAIAGAITERAGKGRLARDTLYGDGRAGPRIAELLAREALPTEKRLAY